MGSKGTRIDSIKGDPAIIVICWQLQKLEIKLIRNENEKVLRRLSRRRKQLRSIRVLHLIRHTDLLNDLNLIKPLSG